MDWEEFLIVKVSDAVLRQQRRDRILAWRQAGAIALSDPDLQAAVEVAGREVAELIDREAAEIRALKAARPPAKAARPRQSGRSAGTPDARGIPRARAGRAARRKPPG